MIVKLLVTKAITSHGKYYAAGDVVEMGDAQARSYMSLFGWTQVEEKPATPPPDDGGGVKAAPNKKKAAARKRTQKKTD